MIAITHGLVRAPATKTAGRVRAKQGKGFFARFWDSLTVTRMRQARREIEKYGHLLPSNRDSHEK